MSNERLPAEAEAIIAAHIRLYLEDPEAAHLWDPIALGVPGGPVRTLLLETRGRKTGQPRLAALQYFRVDGAIVVIASKGGMPNHPVWYLNLVETPACELRVGAERMRAIARTATGDERKRLWDIAANEQPAYLGYQARTAREIPVIVLDPAGA